MPRVYFDSTVYLALLLGEKGRAESAREALDWAAGRDAKGFISALVVAEVIGAPRLRAPQHVPARIGRRQMRMAREYFSGVGFLYVEGGRTVAGRAGELCEHHDLAGPDALHLAMAAHAKCTEFHTFDNDQLKIGSLGDMRICLPHGSAQGELPFDDGRGD